MPGQFYANPDCLEAMEPPEAPIPRTIEELKAAARHADDSGIIYINDAEYDLIKRQIGLGYRWQGRRVVVY